MPRSPRSASSRLAGASIAAALVLLSGGLPVSASAQSYLPQEAFAEVLAAKTDSVESLPYVHYRYYFPEEESHLWARINLKETVGRENMAIIQLLNRTVLETFNRGDTLVVPSRLDVDWRAYSPFPVAYPGAREVEKLVVLDKDLQVFAAYELGRLVRWGLANTGQKSANTPSGRFNFNWQTEYKRSSLNPRWEMHWVMNFHFERGLHIHQYALPTGGPASHGCVRLLDPDAEWLYHWIDTWTRNEQGRVLEQGTPLIVIGDVSDYKPSLFRYRRAYPELKKVDLPADPMSVPPGTDQQRRFDRIRAQRMEAQGSR